MALQTKVNGRQVRGIVGEFSDASPKSARQYIVYGKNTTANPVFGKFFSIKGEVINTGTSDKTIVAVQGQNANSWSMGILVNPKEHFTNGFVTALEMKRNTAGTIATRGHIWVSPVTNVVAGGYVYVNADGDLGGSTLSNGKKVLGAKWLTSCTYDSEKEVNLAEVAIDNPTLDNETGPTSL